MTINRTTLVGVCGMLAVIGSAHAQVTFFTDQAAFDAALPISKLSKGIETFEENTAPSSNLGFPGPLCSDVPSTYFPFGLEGLPNLCIRSDAIPTLFIVKEPNIYGLTTSAVGAGQCNNNTRLDFDEPKTAIAFDLYQLFSFPGDLVVEVYNESGGLIGSQIYTGVGVPNASFVGILAPSGASGVQIVNGGCELVDQIEAWFELPEACCFPDGRCEDRTPSECGLVGGVSQGAGTDCAGSASTCVALAAAAIPTVSEWGLIVLALLMLTAGTIIIRREMVLRAA